MNHCTKVGAANYPWLISHTPWAEAVHKRFEPFLQGQTNYAMIIFEQWFKILSTNYQRNRASKTRVLNITSSHDSTILLVQSSKGPKCRTQGICVLGISRGRLIRTPDQHNHQQTKKTSKILLWVKSLPEHCYTTWCLVQYWSVFPAAQICKLGNAHYS